MNCHVTCKNSEVKYASEPSCRFADVAPLREIASDELFGVSKARSVAVKKEAKMVEGQDSVEQLMLRLSR